MNSIRKKMGSLHGQSVSSKQIDANNCISETEQFETMGEPVPIWMLLDSDSTHEFKYFDEKEWYFLWAEWT